MIEAANRRILADRDDAAIDAFFAPTYVAHGTNRDLSGGPAAVRTFLEGLRRAFADLEARVEVLAETDDRVAWQRTFSGTQTGAYQGFPATNRRIEWRDMVVSRVRDGQVEEDWVVTDLAERLLRALGT